MNDLNVGCISENVLVGEDGYLFLYQGGQRQFDYLTGVLSPSPESVDNFVYNLVSRDKFCEDHKIKYLHVVFPSKPVLGRDKLPEKYRQISSVFERYYKERGLIRNIIYPVSDILSCSNPLLKTDTHYSRLGYLEVFKKIIEELGFDLNLHVSQFDLYRKPYAGDLSKMLSLERKEYADFIFMKEKKEKINFFSNSLAIPGNLNDIAIFHNKKPLFNQRVLVFGDSFFKGMLFLFSYFFKDVVYIRSPFLHEEIALMMSPDIILTGNAERYLSSVKSDKNADCHMMRLYGDTSYSPSEAFIMAYRAELSYNFYPEIYNYWACSQ